MALGRTPEKWPIGPKRRRGNPVVRTTFVCRMDAGPGQVASEPDEFGAIAAGPAEGLERLRTSNPLTPRPTQGGVEIEMER